MVFSLNPTTSLPNHLDLLRHIIDAAALADRRTALTLAVLSKMTQAWVEPIIYTDVNLRHESSGRAFLYTMRTSKTKPPSFFARHVKSLVICSDIEPWLVVDILSVCRGIVNFSYWATPSLSIRQLSSPRFKSISDQGDDHSGPSTEVVAPQRISALFHENHIYPLKPHFNLDFFSRVTHLSILNSWEEWTTWTHAGFDAMPALTHIKFDLNASRPSNMGFQNSELDFTNNLDSCNKTSTTPGSWWLDIKLSSVANTLSEVLNNNRTLRVCILVLRFDIDPTYTAKAIVQLASRKILGSRATNANWFDSRLVFAHEREPFRYGHAHSDHELALWKYAETMVNSQRYVTGYTLLDCSS
ncbi:hypothetical protein BYT27DRAFT_7337567 [Phlegmacium glaucopus]|nr:hypothetical protein BYT27DRAFT_7337567 [Phlegmacium glaucopus]